MLAKVGTEKGIMLSIIQHDETEADFEYEGLQPADGILIASDLRVSDVEMVQLAAQQVDVESAIMLAKVGTRRASCSRIQHDQTEADFEYEGFSLWAYRSV